MPITTRIATSADILDCARVLAQAFADDPLMASIWPDQARRHRALPGYFAASLRHFHVPGGGVQIATDRDGQIGAVAVWDPPGRWNQGLGTTIRAVPDLLPVLGTRIPAAISVRRTLDAHHPHEPEHWYLANIGTTLTQRGRGFAAQLVTDCLDGDPGHGAWLVCTREQNIGYYERFGFAVTDTFILPGAAGATMWAMWREAA